MHNTVSSVAHSSVAHPPVAHSSAVHPPVAKMSRVQQQNMRSLSQDIITFIQETYKKAGKTRGIIAVSGGIDSAVSASLLVRALGVDAVTAVLLPYDAQAPEAIELLDHLGIPEKNRRTILIRNSVDSIFDSLSSGKSDADTSIDSKLDNMRLGNIMARVRMIFLFDIAKHLSGLVCGTENKSEKYLGYYTRFGDEGSDLEPLQDLYKTEVRLLAQFLGIPNSIILKEPSAQLWDGQTDRQELGFSYDVADTVLQAFENICLVEHDDFFTAFEAVYQQEDALPRQEDTVGFADFVVRIAQNAQVSENEVRKVLDHVGRMHFKHKVPYTFYQLKK